MTTKTPSMFEFSHKKAAKHLKKPGENYIINPTPNGLRGPADVARKHRIEKSARRCADAPPVVGWNVRGCQTIHYSNGLVETIFKSSKPRELRTPSETHTKSVTPRNNLNDRASRKHWRKKYFLL